MENVLTIGRKYRMVHQSGREFKKGAKKNLEKQRTFSVDEQEQY